MSRTNTRAVKRGPSEPLDGAFTNMKRAGLTTVPPLASATAGDVLAVNASKSGYVFTVPTAERADEVTSAQAFTAAGEALATADATRYVTAEGTVRIDSAGVTLRGGSRLRLRNVATTAWVDVTVPTLKESYSLTVPTSQGADNARLVNNGSGVLTHGAAESVPFGTRDTTPLDPADNPVSAGLTVVDAVTANVKVYLPPLDGAVVGHQPGESFTIVQRKGGFQMQILPGGNCRVNGEDANFFTSLYAGSTLGRGLTATLATIDRVGDRVGDWVVQTF